MKETLVTRIKEVTLKDPILVEGLPGVGHVGKLVADHMVEELDAEKIMEIYSPHFPPQVMVLEGLTDLMHGELMRPLEKENILILSGDAQPLEEGRRGAVQDGGRLWLVPGLLDEPARDQRADDAVEGVGADVVTKVGPQPGVLLGGEQSH